MRNGPSTRILARAASWTPRIQSWLGGQLLAPDVPIVSGRAFWNASQKVVDGLKITVPRFDGAPDWLPRRPDDPLARYGQQLDVTVTAAGVDVRLGRFEIADWNYTGSTVSVVATGLMQLAVDDRLLEAWAPRDDGTLRSEAIRMLPGKVVAQFDAGLVDREVPATTSWTLERVDNLYAIAKAWPAVIRPDSWGQVLFKPPPVLTDPVLSLTDGEDGTVVTVPRRDTRSGAFNIVKATSKADGVTASATATTTSGPMAVDRYGSVSKEVSSLLLLNEQQCFEMADAERAASLRQSSVLQVEMAPDPRLELDDPVEVIHDGIRDWGLVVAADIPLTVRDGAMRLDVGVL